MGYSVLFRRVCEVYVPTAYVDQAPREVILHQDYYTVSMCSSCRDRQSQERMHACFAVFSLADPLLFRSPLHWLRKIEHPVAHLSMKYMGTAFIVVSSTVYSVLVVTSTRSDGRLMSRY
jgi:hypothetical protein